MEAESTAVTAGNLVAEQRELRLYTEVCSYLAGLDEPKGIRIRCLSSNSHFMISAPSSNGPFNLKRTRSGGSNEPPPLPKIKSELILSIYTHKSLGRATADYGDNERLSVLGKQVLIAVVNQFLFKSRPMLRASEFCVGTRLSLGFLTYLSLTWFTTETKRGGAFRLQHQFLG